MRNSKTPRSAIHLATLLLLCLSFLSSCEVRTGSEVQVVNPIMGTWQLFSGAAITKGDSIVTDYTKGQRMIKIINDSHFAFFKHDLDPKKDSSNHFDAGGGSYNIKGDQYSETLEFYSDHKWENKTFNFTVTISHDTLIQKGLEKVEGTGIDRTIIEKYVRISSTEPHSN